MKKVLFVCYGSGHVRMVLPLAQALQAGGAVQVQVLGLTTAAAEVRAAGLPLLQFKDFLQPGDEAALARGRELTARLGDVVDPEESAAYLGLSHADLEAEVGAEEAAMRYARDGRQAYLPRRTLARILRQLQPDLVVATNSPRAERAAIEAARALGIRSVCVVDLFAVDEVRWIGQAGYADRVCVLNEAVREFLVAAGRRPEEIVATGNPAFDALHAPGLSLQGAALRAARGWGAGRWGAFGNPPYDTGASSHVEYDNRRVGSRGDPTDTVASSHVEYDDRRVGSRSDPTGIDHSSKRVLLWPTQVEPALHPFDGTPGDTTLPDRTLQALVDWTLAQPDAVLCVRPRAGQALPALPAHERIVVTGQDWPLPPLLHAVDLVVTLTSTVGLEGHLAGARLVQVLGSVFDEAMPLARFGIADAAVPLAALPAALDRWSRAGRRTMQGEAGATARVMSVIGEFL